MRQASNHGNNQNMKWWQLSLFGVGCTIGTGFFLGSSIAIRKSGPSVLLAFILAALGTYIVFDALAKMTAADPQEGAFRTYGKKAFGHWAGFSIGWVYWSSEMLIMGSQLTALSIFTRFWFPNIPLWLFAVGYAILGLIVLMIGVKGLNRLENVLGIVKIAAILMFIIIAVLAFFGVFEGTRETDIPTTYNEFFPRGFMGLWTSLIFAFYAFGGIEVMGLMATRLQNKKDAPKSGKIMLLLLTTIYLIAIGLAILLIRWDTFNTEKSPFISALKNFELPFVPHLFNAVLIIAGFSILAASLYAVTSILVSLAKDGDAPSLFAKKGKLNIPLPALGLTISGIAVSIIMALVMPDNIYEYITTAAGLMLLYNWFFILLSSRRLLKLAIQDHIKYFIGMAIIFAAISGTIFNESSRPGFLTSLGFVAVIAVVTLIMYSIWKRKDNETVFRKLE